MSVSRTTGIGRSGLCVVTVLAVSAQAVPPADLPMPEQVIPNSVIAPVSLAAGDLDGDGDTDFAAASYADGRITWYEKYNTTPPTFGEHVLSDTSHQAFSVSVADVDVDGDLDIVCGWGGEQHVDVYENTGGIPPVFVQHIVSSNSRGRSVCVLDLPALSAVFPVIVSASSQNITLHVPNPLFDPWPYSDWEIASGYDNAQSVHAADVNGDGATDVLVAYADSDAIAWYEFDAGLPPPYTEHVVTTTAIGAGSVFAADLDGDDDADVLSASQLDDTIAWYENGGGLTPTFTKRSITTTADLATCVFAADVDGDGDVDVLSTAGLDDVVAWHENDGNAPPGFTEHVISDTAAGPYAVFAVDLDGDDDTDVVSGSLNTGKIAWYWNLAHEVYNETTGQGSATIAAAVADAASGHVLLAAPTRFPDEPNVDFQGKAISLRSWGPIDLPALGRYVLADGATLETGVGFDITVRGDLVAPAGADVILAAANLAVDHGGRLEGGAGSEFWIQSGAVVEGAVAIGADGHVIVQGNMDISPSGTELTTERIISGGWLLDPRGLCTADLDGDGDEDVLATDLTADVITWHENVGDVLPTHFYNWPNVLSGTVNDPMSVVAADLDGDGDQDVACASSGDGRITWHESTGGSPPGFTERDVTTGAAGARSVFAADVNGDGRVDLLSAAFDDDTIAWHENLGGTPLGWAAHDPISTSAVGARSVFAADLDGDGDVDVLSASSGDDTIAWHENLGGLAPAFTEHVVTTAAGGASGVAAADVDGDGDTDIVATSFDDDTVEWYENDGAASPAFTEHVISNAADGAAHLVAADFNGDGDPDVLASSSNDDTVAWFENPGGPATGVWIPHVISGDALAAQTVFVADIDGDGDPDALSTSAGDARVDWYENRTGSVGMQSFSHLSVQGYLHNRGFVDFEGELTTDSALFNDGSLRCEGHIQSSVSNGGLLRVPELAGLRITGACANTGTISLDGTSFEVMETMLHHGRLVGSGSDFRVVDDFTAGASAVMRLAPSSLVRFSAEWDVAIDDTRHFGLDEARFRAQAPGPKTFEAMSVDIGPSPLGLDGDRPGHYPIGELRVTPQAGVVLVLTDLRDNDNLGQTQGEAIYVQELIVDAGTTLTTGTTHVYYLDLTLDGTVDDPANLIPIGASAPGDTNGDGAVDVNDLNNIILDWGTDGSAHGGDIAGVMPGSPPDGVVDVNDLNAVIVNWGAS